MVTFFSSWRETLADGSQAADGLLAVGDAHRLGGVLDQRDARPVGLGQERIEVTGHVLQMHRDDGSRPRGELRGHVGVVEAEGVVDLREHRDGASDHDGVHGGDEGERGHDDLVAAAHPEGGQGAPQGGGPARGRNGEPGSRRACKRLFELRDLPEEVRAVVAEQRSALEDLEDGAPLLVPQQPRALGKIERSFDDRLAPVDRQVLDGRHRGRA